ncbi:uncharacterized protein LOC116287568 isoform X2 [Actinia tenebrosa]|uniref:Uncharacterized protein LOC116287568 isoform X2 n=1 Tax=Actinia tenebrosa TaxID=6105 RepID=A0A6P8H134_ACTTE|nr:uncharacterized protein LOC116287568 isoform X2 [Actinia tenebrosa]
MAEKEGKNDASNQNQSDQICGEETIADKSTQATVNEDTDPEPTILVEEIEFGNIRFGGNAYRDTYRNGNFGVKRGRVNFTRARIWSSAHLFSAGAVALISTLCIANGDEADLFVLPFLSAFFGILTFCGGVYLSLSPTTVGRPLFVLLLVRMFALLECMVVLLSIIYTIIVASDRGNPRNGALVVSLVVDWITALAWLFHWWKYCVCCQCLKSCCIFEPGEPLAPGVPDPPTGLLRECVYVLWMAICRSDWTLV